jgi:hypothetical protein
MLDDTTPPPVVTTPGDGARGIDLAGTARSRTARALDVASTIGSIVTLAALVVLGATAAGGLVHGGGPSDTDSTLTVTYDGGR